MSPPAIRLPSFSNSWRTCRGACRVFRTKRDVREDLVLVAGKGGAGFAVAGGGRGGSEGGGVGDGEEGGGLLLDEAQAVPRGPHRLCRVQDKGGRDVDAVRDGRVLPVPPIYHPQSVTGSGVSQLPCHVHAPQIDDVGGGKRRQRVFDMRWRANLRREVGVEWKLGPSTSMVGAGQLCRECNVGFRLQSHTSMIEEPASQPTHRSASSGDSRRMGKQSRESVDSTAGDTGKQR